MSQIHLKTISALPQVSFFSPLPIVCSTPVSAITKTDVRTSLTPHRVTRTQTVSFVSIDQNLKLRVHVPAGGTLLRAFFEVAVPSLQLRSKESKILCLINTFIGQISYSQAEKYLVNPHLALAHSRGVDIEGTRPFAISGREPFGQSEPVHSFTSKELSRHDAEVRRAGEVCGAKAMAISAATVMQQSAALQLYVRVENIDCDLNISPLPNFTSIFILPPPPRPFRPPPPRAGASGPTTNVLAVINWKKPYETDWGSARCSVLRFLFVHLSLQVRRAANSLDFCIDISNIISISVISNCSVTFLSLRSQPRKCSRRSYVGSLASPGGRCSSSVE